MWVLKLFHSYSKTCDCFTVLLWKESDSLSLIILLLEIKSILHIHSIPFALMHYPQGNWDYESPVGIAK